MRKRDQAILSDLERFRVMSRDDIVDLHFSHLKQPVTACNTVLKRLRRDGRIEANTTQQPFLYFPAPLRMKKDSTKIPHFLEILRFYRELCKHSKPKQFIVEPKYSDKGKYMEPDAFMIWNSTPFFVEIQRNIYTKKVMQQKITRYEAYYDSDLWQDEPWQPDHKKVFPIILMQTDHKYALESPYLRFIQFDSVNTLVNMSKPRKTQNTGIRMDLR